MPPPPPTTSSQNLCDQPRNEKGVARVKVMQQSKVVVVAAGTAWPALQAAQGFSTLGTLSRGVLPPDAMCHAKSALVEGLSRVNEQMSLIIAVRVRGEAEGTTRSTPNLMSMCMTS